MADEQRVRYDLSDGVATITLDSPSNRNALSSQLVAELLRHLDTAAEDGTVRCIVIAAAGPVFCSGADLKDPPSNVSGSPFSFPDVLSSIRSCPKVVIAKVEGHVRAGGLGIVAACDIAVAIDDVNFAFAEVRIGVVPAIIAVVCQPVMTPRSFARYVLTGETFGADAAARSGLVTVVVERPSIESTLRGLLDEIRRTAPKAVARSKRLIAEVPTWPSSAAFPNAAAISADLFSSEEAAEGIAAFRERRDPAWVPSR